MMSMLGTREYHLSQYSVCVEKKKMEVESWRSGRLLPDLVLLLLRVFRNSTRPTGVLVVCRPAVPVSTSRDVER